MQLKDRIKAFVKLGICLRDLSNPPHIKHNDNLERLSDHCINAMHYNGWFTKENVVHAIKAISLLLEEDRLNNWLSAYPFNKTKPKRIGVIMAGNIPLVGFHDFLCILITGNVVVGKLSSKDKHLFPIIAEILINIEPRFMDKIEFTDGKVENINALIGTGSDNTSRYLEYYYGKYPNLFRKNRNALAILNRNETKRDIEMLGKDIFTYYGLGCRNVSKLMVPSNYNMDFFFGGIFKYKGVLEHNKYANNYDYYKAIYAMNKIKIIENGFLLLKEDSSLSSPVAVLHFEYYDGKSDLEKKINRQIDQIQCIVSQNEIKNISTISMGMSQCPQLDDYADNADTISFLTSLN
ncbi:MAG TPA: acyl-CoA reductase [Flavobacteriales bacterium]|nr:acyl-CoA reductase [Flavobacteriales bacterium]